MDKSPDAFRTISEVADWLGTPTHVLRFWESRFTQVKPVKRAGGRRYYRPADMELLGGIKRLLHDDGMTIRGVQKLLREEGVKHVAAFSPPLGTETAIEAEPVVRPENDQASDRVGDAPEAPMIEDAVTPDIVDNVVQMDGSVVSDDANQKPPVPDAAEVQPPEEPAPPLHDEPTAQDPVPAAPDAETAAQDNLEPELIFDGTDADTVTDTDTDAKTDTDADAGAEAAAEIVDEPQAPADADAPDQKPLDGAPDTPQETTPTPILADVPADPDDDDTSFPGIADVAATLRKARDGAAPSLGTDDTIAVLYERLSALRERMGNGGNSRKDL